MLVIALIFACLTVSCEDIYGQVNPNTPETFAILKISFNKDKIEDKSFFPRILGSAFFISDSVAITAHHVLRPSTLIPDLH